VKLTSAKATNDKVTFKSSKAGVLKVDKARSAPQRHCEPAAGGRGNPCGDDSRRTTGPVRSAGFGEFGVFEKLGLTYRFFL
jgi:hypothetical protein